MSDMMRVLLFDGPRQFHIESRPLPKPGAGDVRIRVAYTGICGSDLHGYTGESGRRVAGMIMGHEASGWIDEIGPDVVGVASGAPVTFNPALPCDGSCGHKVENQCSRLRVIGVTPDLAGAFADTVVVPANRVVPIDGTSMRFGAAIEPVAVGVHAVRRAGVVPGDAVLVIGGGMIGQCVARAARLAGASRIVVSDLFAERNELSSRSGFEAMEPGEVPLGHFDRSVDAVGASPTASMAISAIRKGGVACFVGLERPEITVPLFDIVVGERHIVGTFAYTDQAFNDAAVHLATGDLDIDDLIGPTVSMEETPDAFAALADGKRREVKIMMHTGAEDGAS
jgi:2-desacetyl-2-hydroxyethyl bacteriochlorophyllide A dehydrogenase